MPKGGARPGSGKPPAAPNAPILRRLAQLEQSVNAANQRGELTKDQRAELVKRAAAIMAMLA